MSLRMPDHLVQEATYLGEKTSTMSRDTNCDKTDKGNQTEIKEFIFIGLSDNPHDQLFLFVVFLCIYLITVSGNLCIIIIYNLSCTLHTPMYFNLANIAFIEICYVSVIVPKMLANLLAECKTISFKACAAQMFFSFLFGGTECYMLAAMAYDRYKAICHPLTYMVTMRRSVCVQLIAGSWIISAANALTHTVLTFRVSFCGSRRINNFFCDVPPVLELACTDIWINEIVVFMVGGCVVIGSFILTLLSYVKIISTILSLHSRSGRRKAFSTCTSHFTVVAVFYSSAIFMYFRPKSAYSMYQDRMASVMYTIIAPLLNPFIYTLRNNDVKEALMRMKHQ